MPLKAHGHAANPFPGFAAWRLVLWLLLMLAVFGCLQYARHAEYIYLAASLAVIVVSAGCILRQAWARDAMRVVAVLLAVWSLVTGGVMLTQWSQLEEARQAAQAQPQMAELAMMMVERARRTYQIVLVFKAIAVPVMLWLAWQLGRPSVSAQFRTRGA
ncbi:hypothetical protein [Dyella subtropica]|uniref:hypothetical protein n=1 Tax=Dyella subtropica TaxID=2992127 RepID=UPI00224D2C10|nr:hypothetical protein [Dyella subtropica]